MKFYFLSLGCDKNLSDSEHMLALLSEAGYQSTDDEKEADIAIVNTCCFIGDAKEESIREILRLGELKKTGRLQVLVLTGCLSERYRAELLKELPEVDGALGIGSWDRIVSLVKEALEQKKPMLFDSNDRLPEAEKRINSAGSFYGYLKIAEGCDKHCTYCVIPKVRGRYRSVPMERLIREAESMAAQGVKELILVAQETTVYGSDLYGKKALTELLKRLSGIPELVWIRILYCYPEEITEELCREMKENPKVVHYLDLPVQHASDRILHRMNRRTDRKELLSRISMLRKEIPDICLRTTLITGFPGERASDFRTLRQFVKDVKFDRLGVFTYSREEGTPAAAMKEQVPEFIKKFRRDRIMKLQQKIVFRHAEEMIGSETELIIEGRVTGEDHVYVGRTYRDAPDVDGYIFVRSEKEYMSGDRVRAVIRSSRGYDLSGEIVGEEDD